MEQLVQFASETELSSQHSFAAAALAAGALYAASLRVSQVVSPLVCASYSKLRKQDRMDWDGRLISNLHALFITVVAAYLFLVSNVFSDSGPGPVLSRTHMLSDLALGFSSGYFLTDLVYMVQHSCLGGPEMAIHHVAALASVATAGLQQQGHNYTLAMLATEMTTPFVNLRWLLDKANNKEGSLYMLNGVALMLVWLMGRIVLFLPFFRHVYTHWHEVRELQWGPWALLILVPALLLTLNVFWFAKILRGALKLLLGSPKQKAHHADEASPAVLSSHPSASHKAD